MKTMNTLLAVSVLLLVAGCATTFKPWKLSEIREGMDRAEVVDILGTPDYTEERDGAEYLYYTYQEEMTPRAAVSLESREGVERRVEEFNRKLNKYRYSVMLVDGRMVSYKEVRE